MDFILNGQATGDVASLLMEHDFNVNALRPYIGNDGRSYITSYNGTTGEFEAKPIMNATATLRKEEWKHLDMAIIKAAKPRLKFVADLRAAGLTYTIPNGMGKTVLESERQSDISDATMSMDGLAKSDRDRPHYDLVTLPLPIIHKDFSFSARQIAASRSGGSPLDTTMAELAGRKVAEYAEKLSLGSLNTYAFGGGTIYGLTNFPSRMTATITSPAASGWTPAVTVADVLSMRQQAKTASHFGPYKLYLGTSWDQYLDEDYSASKGDNTLRQRLQAIPDISSVQTLDYLSGYAAILVQMTSDVVREVIGMDFTTVQWPSQGGLQLNYKVMGIMVPQLRADFNNKTGIVHGSV